MINKEQLFDIGDKIKLKPINEILNIMKEYFVDRSIPSGYCMLFTKKCFQEKTYIVTDVRKCGNIYELSLLNDDFLLYKKLQDYFVLVQRFEQNDLIFGNMTFN